MENKVKRRAYFFAIAVVLACTAFSNAGPIIFSDNFDSENGGVGQLNYDSFTNWDVENGNIDLIGNDFYDFLPGNGLYVDMDGSSTSAGKIVSKTSFSLVASGNYVLQFDLAGAQSPDNEDDDFVVVRVGDGFLFDQTYSLETDDPFQTYTETFHVGSATSAKISFEGIGQDMRGMLLDNIILAYIPSPGAIVLGSVGVAIIGWLRRLRTL